MRATTDVLLDQVIVHILDSKGSQRLILSDACLQLEEEPDVRDYFTRHIVNSLSDETSKAAKFLDVQGGRACCACQALLDGTAEFVAGSQALAVHLYEILDRDRRIAAGDFAVCFFHDGSQKTEERFLALVKIDPGKVFRHATVTDDAGRSYVTLKAESDALPSTNEHLQKCAFVQSVRPRREYDMMLLDRQISPDAPRGVAQFFSGTFLGAELALSPLQRTQGLYKALMIGRNKLRPILAPRDMEMLIEASDVALRSAQIDVDSWVDSLDIPVEPRSDLKNVIHNYVPDRQFTLDTDYAERKARKKRFRGDGDLKVEVAADRYSDIIAVKRVDRDGEVNHYEVTIRTEEWTEVAR